MGPLTLLDLLPLAGGTKTSSLKQLSDRAGDLVKVATGTLRDDVSQNSDSDSDDENYATPGYPSIEDLAEDLETDIQCLVDLGPRYKDPVRDPPNESASCNLSEYLADRIHRLYPGGDDTLMSALGRANWDRTTRLITERSKNIQNTDEQQEPANIISFESLDSGPHASVLTATPYAETMVSYHGPWGDSIRIPQLPAGAVRGEPFTCEACGQTVQIRNSSAWR